MNAKKLYDFVKNPQADIETLISNGIFSDVLALFPELIKDIIKRDPYYAIRMINLDDIEAHPELAATAIDNGFWDISYFTNKILRKGIVKNSIFRKLCKPDCNIDPNDVPKTVISTYKDVISKCIADGDVFLINNLPESCYWVFFDSFVKFFNSDSYENGSLVDCFSDEFLISHEEFFFKILNNNTIRYFSKPVLMNFASKFPEEVLSYHNFYKYNKGSFAEYFKSHEKEVCNCFSNGYNFSWNDLQKFDKEGLTKDMIRKIYGYFKAFISNKNNKTYYSSGTFYYFFISEIFGANYLKGLDDIVCDICLNSDKALEEYGFNISDKDIILKIICRNPKDIVYLNDLFLEDIDITTENFKTE